ncbi:MAG: DUF4019 domain-containing protein [Deltaproteobacteria bacterium]|nr:DUF4019 domain-containing protein [Deltaproteobacteria bacterium]
MVRVKVFLIVLGIVVVFTQMAVASEKEKAALSAAEAWLQMVDDGKYIESWNEAAKYLKNAVTTEQWEQSLNAGRSPMGKLISRGVKGMNYMTALPGTPDGEYVVIQFNTVFENKKQAVETVTPMMEPDGKWRVSGYYIK